ncbi:DUF413 domain-containing protein [Vibrio maerlii]|uniref:DUF413 domain-containing protein n=1 Tax=Vibrio maerlii TaxID=2231648 RepID=UPI000E3D6BDD|nr:DUF413 domain-containing protein [Vibrio maerlii]
MTEFDVRVGTKPFYDNNKFKRGFAKSGDFTIAEENILIHYGDTLRQLTDGSLLPESDQENQLIRVLSGEAEAESKLEKTWQKYQKLAFGRRKFHGLATTNRANADDDNDSDTDDNEDISINGNSGDDDD